MAATLAKNENIRDGALGSLCWARWEVARHLLAFLSSTRTEAETADDFERSLDDAEDAASHAVNRIPEELQEFAAKLVGDVRAVREEFRDSRARGMTNTEAIEGRFEFETYPAARSYANAAATHRECVTP